MQLFRAFKFCQVNSIFIFSFKKINKIKLFFVLNIYNIFPITVSVTVSNNTSHPHSFWNFYLAY